MSSVPASPPPGYAARLGRGLRSPRARTWLVHFPVWFVASVVTVGAWDVRTHGPHDANEVTGTALLLWLVGAAGFASLSWRRRFPEAVTAGNAVLTLLLPLDPTVALIAFGSLAVRRLDRVTAGLGGLVAAATFMATWRDGRGESRAASFWQLVAHSDADLHATLEPLTLPVVLAITGVAVAVVLALALVLRDRSQRAARAQIERDQRVVVETLSDEVSRQAERERLAQEVHDALGHRLSLLSLHAGALEVAAGEGTKAAESAALVRANAQQSMADLRSLLTMLRQPGSPDVTAAVPTLRDAEGLIDDTVSTGVTLVSTVHLEGIDRLDATTSRTAFRIVQELLTNARRHAPGIGIRMRLLANPTRGVEIEVANHLPAGATGEVVPGSGLRGIRHRVEQLRGEWRCWVDDQRVFRAAAHLPWVWATAVGSEPGESSVTGTGRPE